MAQGGPESLLNLGCAALPTGNFEALWEPWSELIRIYPRHWAAAAVLPLLVDAGGGLEAQEKLNSLLREQQSRASDQLFSLIRDLLGPTQRLRWKGGAQAAKLAWRNLQPSPDSSWCGIDQLNTYDQCRFYAGTMIRMDQELDTFLECDPGYSDVRVWLNEQMVLRASRQSPHYWAGMPFRVPIHLRPGDNQLLLRLDRETKSIHLRLRLGVNVLDSRPVALRPSGLEIPASEPWLLRAIPEEWKLLRADYQFRLGQDEKATELLAPWSEAYPESAFLAWLRDRMGVEHKLWEQLRHKVPEWAGGQASGIDRFWSRGRLGPDAGRAHFELFCFSGSDPEENCAPLVGAVLPELARLLTLFPGHPWLLERRLALMTPYSFPVQAQRISEAELPEAARIMEALAKFYPNGWGWDYNRLARVHTRLGNLLRARQCYRKAAAYRPNDPSAWETLARFEEEPSKAAAAYEQALRLSPERIDLRDQIKQCQGAAPLLESLAPPQACRPPWELQSEELVWGQKVGFYDVCDSQYPARSILLQEMRQVVYADGASYGFYRLVAETPRDRVYSPEYPKPVRRLHTRLRTSLLYRQDGRVQDTMDLSQGGWPAFPDCEDGDIAEAAWMASSSGLVGGGFCQEWDLLGAARYVLVRPADQTLHNTRQPDQTVFHDNWKIDTWTSPGLLKVSTFSSWSELARVLGRQLRRPINPAIRSQALALGSARGVVKWVEKCDDDWEALWSECEPVWRVLDRKFGIETSDAVLLCSLMRVLKIRTDLCFPVLDTSFPGVWFGKPCVIILDKEPFWWRRPSLPHPLLSLTHGLLPA